MANTFTFSRTGNIVKVEEYNSVPTLVNVSTFSTLHNIFKGTKDDKTVVITRHSSFAGIGIDTKEFPIADITGNPTPTDVLATISWLSTTYFTPTATAGSATEATLVSVLNAVVASDQDIEILLVRDTVTLTVYQQITNYETGTPVVTYKDVSGTPFVPVNPMEYLDPSTVLNLILTELQKKSNFKKITEEANDAIETYTFFDPGTSDERPNTIVYSSVALGLTVTETYVWAGSSPNFYISTKTLS